MVDFTKSIFTMESIVIETEPKGITFVTNSEFPTLDTQSVETRSPMTEAHLRSRPPLQSKLEMLKNHTRHILSYLIIPSVKKYFNAIF